MKFLKLRTAAICAALFLFVMVPFQNCAQQFKISEDGLQSLDSSVLSTPIVTFASSPQLISQNSITASFEISGEQIVLVSCALNSGATQDCQTGSVTYSNLVDGDHVIDVRVVNSRGGEGTARKSFRKDGTAPVINVSMMPQASSSQTSAGFVFAVSDNLSGVASVQCSLNNAAFANCASPVTLSGLAVASHNYRIQATDMAGNSSLIYSYNWQVTQILNPSVNIQSLPPTLSNQTAITFNFTGQDVVSYECQLDTAAYAACSSPRNYTGVTAGAHTFRLRGVTATGVRTAEAVASWTVDLTAPTVPLLTSSVSAMTNQTSASISFSSTDASGIATYQCSLNNAAFSNCTSPAAVNGLANSSHNFRVQARDSAGNLSNIGQFNWTVDTMAPILSFSQTPQASTTSQIANFIFSATDSGSGISFTRCSLDNAAFTNCTSPVSFTALAVGNHNFRVQSQDNVGNSSLITHSWVITAVAPPPTPSIGTPLSSARIFLSGHSLMDDPLGENIEMIAQSLSTQLWWNQQIGIGSPLRLRTHGDNMTDPTFPGYRTGKNKNGSNMNVISEFLNPQTISGQRYDTLVMTERHDIAGVLEWEGTVRYARHFHDRLVAGNSQANSYFYHSWLDIADKSNPMAWVQFERNNAIAWQCTADRINVSLVAEGRSNRVTYLPAGLALTNLIEQATQGNVPGITSSSSTATVNVLFSDSVHMTRVGTYYMALVTYASVYRRSPVGASYPSGVTAQQAQSLQQIAWASVSNYYSTATARTMQQCQTQMRDNFCASYHQYRGTSQETANCRNFFMGQTNENPFYYNAATDANYWLRAPQ